MRERETIIHDIGKVERSRDDRWVPVTVEQEIKKSPSSRPNNRFSMHKLFLSFPRYVIAATSYTNFSLTRHWSTCSRIRFPFPERITVVRLYVKRAILLPRRNDVIAYLSAALIASKKKSPNLTNSTVTTKYL